MQGVGEQVQSDAEETDEFIGVPAELPARLRRHRALRRLVRHRELAVDHDRAAHASSATLRMLGASRRQVLTSIILEALVVGVIASVIGLFLGLLLAKGLFSA